MPGGEQGCWGGPGPRVVMLPVGSLALALGLGNAGQVAGEVTRLEGGKVEIHHVRIEELPDETGEGAKAAEVAAAGGGPARL